VLPLLLLVFAGCSSRGAVGILQHEVGVKVDGRTLTLLVESCQGRPKATVHESPTQVRIEVRSEIHRGGQRTACADGLTVRLKQPLGDRSVMDVKTGRTLEITRAHL
jgi:hypothetical protein